MNQNKFIEELKKIGIEVNDTQLAQLEKYYELLVEWNKFMNLTGITEKDEVYLKHFYDSLTIIKIIDLNKIETLCDIGTGAGFPGLVLKILFPNLKITLIDSLNKRINFLNNVINELKLKDIEAIHARVEEYGISNREKYDIVTARAVAPLNILLEYSIPLVKINGNFVAMKANVENEIEESNNALSKLECKIEKIEKFILPIENSNRTLINIKKINQTKKVFPRKYNDIKRKPL